jgi:hypothetical protein
MQDNELSDLQDQFYNAISNARAVYQRLRPWISSVNVPAKPGRLSSVDSTGGGEKQVRDTKSMWLSVFQIVYFSRGIYFDYTDLRFAIQMHGFDIPEGTLRARVSSYIFKKYLNRIESGRFEMTESGKLFFGICNFDIHL